MQYVDVILVLAGAAYATGGGLQLQDHQEGQKWTEWRLQGRRRISLHTAAL